MNVLKNQTPAKQLTTNPLILLGVSPIQTKAKIKINPNSNASFMRIIIILKYFFNVLSI
jgi:hypothetical protein